MISVAGKGKAGICCEAAVCWRSRTESLSDVAAVWRLPAALASQPVVRPGFVSQVVLGHRESGHNVGLREKHVSSALLTPVQHSFHFIITGSGRGGRTCDRAAQLRDTLQDCLLAKTEKQVSAATCCSSFWSSSKTLDVREALQWSRETCRFLPSCNTPLVKTGQWVRQLCVRQLMWKPHRKKSSCLYFSCGLI